MSGGRHVLLTLILATFPWTVMAAQQPIAGGRILGEVVDVASGGPVSGARVLIVQFRGSGNQREVVSDEKGAFLLDEVAPGSYLLHAEHTGYITSQLPTGYARPVPININVEAGGSYRVSFRLVRTGSISGRVYDVERRPVTNAEVEILFSQYNGFGLRTLSRLTIAAPGPDGYPSVQTDDRGEYHLSGIPAGEYYIRASYKVESVRRGGAAVRSNSASATYYPGVTNPDEAIAIRIAAGDDISAIDFTAAPLSATKVSGRIINPLPQQPARPIYDYYLIPRNARVREFTQVVPNYSEEPDRFELRSVRPGSYDLYIAYRTGERPDQFKFYSGRVSIEVSDRDVIDLAVPIEPGIEIRGEIVQDEATRATNRDVRRNYPLFSSFDGMPGVLSPTATLGRSPFVQSDGSFVIPNAARGRYFLVLGGEPTAFITSARLGTENILGRPFEVTTDTTGPLVVEISAVGGTVQGTVNDKDGAPARGAQVVLVPPFEFREDQTSYKSTTSDNRGRFNISGLRPGRYMAYAVAGSADVRAWMNPEFVLPIQHQGVPFEVFRGRNTEQDLRLIVRP